MRALIAAAPLLSILLSLSGGGFLAWQARGVAFQWFERPAIIRAQQEICTATVQKAAAAARVAEQLRQFQISEWATSRYLEGLAADADTEQASQTALTQEATGYEDYLATRGKECGFTQLDLDYLDGRVVQPDGAVSGGG